MTANRGLRPDYNDLLVCASCSRGLGAGFDYSDDCHMSRSRNTVEGEGSSCVTGNDQHLSAVRFKVVRGFNRAAGDGFNRLGTVGQARRIAKIDVLGLRDKFK